MTNKLIFFTLLISIPCKTTIGQNAILPNELYAFKVSEIIPYVDSTGRVYKYDSLSVRVFYYKNASQFELNYFAKVYDTTEQHNLKIAERRYHTVVFNNDSLYGYDIDEHRSPSKAYVFLGSVFRSAWVKQTRLYPMFQRYKPTIVNSQKSPDNSTLTLTYILSNPVDGAKASECVLKYSNKVENIPVSLCTQLDTIPGFKLTYFMFEVDAEYAKRFGITSGRQYSRYTLEKIQVTDKSAILNNFKYVLD